MNSISRLFFAFAFVGVSLLSQASFASLSDDIQPFVSKDPSLKAFLDKSYAFVVFPKIGKGGFGIGGAMGRGRVYQDGKLVGTSKIKQIMIGALIGGQSYSQIVVFGNESAFNKFKRGKLEFSAQVAAVAIEKGVAENASLHDGLAIFTTKHRGAMAEASVSGQKLSFSPIN